MTHPMTHPDADLEPGMSLDQIEQRKSRHQETWESTIAGRISMQTLNHLGRPRRLTVKGRGQRLRLSTLDRELVEETIRSAVHNPFRNGMLVRIDAKAESAEALTDEDLHELFAVTDDAEFADLVGQLGEVNIRRLRRMADDNEVQVTVGQDKVITDLIAERYAVGGSTRVYEELTATQD